MLALSPALLMSAAAALVNRRRIGRTESGVRIPADSVSTAAFVNHVGYWAHRQSGESSTWPFPLDADCNDLARLADAKGVLRDRPTEEGDLFLQYARGVGFIRAGIVIDAEFLSTAARGHHYECLVYEGTAALAALRSPHKNGELHVGSRVISARKSQTRVYP